MEYERITDEKFVKAVETCNMACVYGENCIECVYFKVDNCPESIQSKLKKAILRLAELENRIEQGTLIELGYHIRKSYRNHNDQRYKIVVVEENEIDKIGYDGLTREEAEKCLKGAQE